MASRPRSSRGRAAPARSPAALSAWLPAQRWFAAKSRRIEGVTTVDEAPVPGTTAVLTLVRVALSGGGHETYLVPLAAATRSDEIADAADDPRFATALVEHMRAGSTLPGRRGAFRFVASPLLAQWLPEPARDARPLGVEQSNTSRVVDERLVLKLVRRLEEGVSPELELTRFLSEETDFRDTARLAGYGAYEAPGQEALTVATLAELVENDGDAWSAFMASLADYYATVGSGAGEDRAADPAFAQAQAAADARQARALGALTGRLHIALASAPPGSPLRPEPIQIGDVAAWRREIEERLDGAVAALATAMDRLPGDAHGLAQEVLQDVPRIRDTLPALEALATEGVSKIRLHGDYHLGQVLRTASGFVVLDFEGEPTRSLAARRAKGSALRDVAGMLRSFSYAARGALLRAIEARPDEPRLLERLLPWADAWEDGVREAFLEGYLGATASRQATFVPRRREVLEGALHAFELDKALYELGYELDVRPGWVRIPLEGLRRALRPAPRPGPAVLTNAEGPFAFVACLQLMEFVGVRAENERQLAELMDQAPLDCIYFHTHGFLLRHRFAAGIYPNDFATWAAVQVRDQVLGERLAMVDPGEFPGLQALREELVAVVDAHLRTMPVNPRVVSGDPFDFVRSRTVEVPTGIEVRTLPELRQALLEVDASAIYFHLVEARLRLGRRQNDFAAWLERALRLPDLAARMRAINPYGGSLERARTRLIQLCDQALAQGVGR
jgi:maltose alpha-D-glucosyltransferase/alpha-amylase